MRSCLAHQRILPRLTSAGRAPVVLGAWTITLEVNGERYVVEPGGRRLLAVLRDDLELLGTKLACGEGACGACAVLVDGRPVNSCLLLAEAAAGHEIVTIEGLSTRPRGGASRRRSSPRTRCSAASARPGQIVSATALLERTPAADARADPRGDGRQPLPLRRLPQDRARDPARRRWRMTPASSARRRRWRAATRTSGRSSTRATTPTSWAPDAELALVGRPAPRQDGAARAAGRVRFTVDVRLAGMLHAAVLRSPVAHGRVRSLDLDAARAIPGVRAVIGPESELSLTTKRAAPRRRARRTPAQPIAVVAADTLEAARAGVAALALELEVLPHVVDLQEAVNEQRFTKDPTDDARGDAEAALAAAEVTVELALETPAQRADSARAARRGRLAGTATSSPRGSRRRGCSPPATSSRRRSGCARTTCACGRSSSAAASVRKQGAGFEALAAAELARITGRPVRLVNDRHAEQLDGGRRAATRQTVRLGARPRRHAHGDRRRRGRRDGAGRLGLPRADPRAHALPLRRRARADASP